MELITRKQALEQGLATYFTGKPCKHGHVAKRNVHGGCIECRKAIKRQNYQKHHALTEEQLTTSCMICGITFVGRTRNQNVCGEACRMKKTAVRAAAWKKANTERLRELNKAAWANPERRQAIQARIGRYVAANREACRERWTSNTRRRIETGEHQALCGKRRRRIAVNTPEMTAAEHAKLAQFYRVARLLAKRYGTSFDVDHIIPLSKGGEHHPRNLQILTASENRSKGAKLPAAAGAFSCCLD